MKSGPLDKSNKGSIIKIVNKGNDKYLILLCYYKNRLNNVFIIRGQV